MSRLLALALLSGCALETWAVPRPVFSTGQPADAFARVVEATKQHCGGLRNINEEAGIVLSPWQAWNTADGLVLTQCLVALQRGDRDAREVRVTFSARTCPLSDMTDLEAIAGTCERTDVVPQLVGNGLRRIAEQLQADIAR